MAGFNKGGNPESQHHNEGVQDCQNNPELLARLKSGYEKTKNVISTGTKIACLTILAQAADASQGKALAQNDQIQNNQDSTQVEMSSQTGSQVDLSTLEAKIYTSKEIHEQLVQWGISPLAVPGVRVQDITIEPGQYQEVVSKTELFGEEAFTKDNIAQRLEQIAESMSHDPFFAQYREGAWSLRLAEVNPNDDEARMLNKYVKSLPEQVKPLVAWQGMTAVLALDRFANQDQDDAMEFIKLANIHAVLAALNTELVEGSKKLILPEELNSKTYAYIEPTFERVAEVNKILNTKIPADKISDYAEAYKKVIAAGKAEFRKNMLAEYINDYEMSAEEAEEMVAVDIEETYPAIIEALESGQELYETTIDTVKALMPETAYRYFAALPEENFNRVYVYVENQQARENLEKVRQEGEKLEKELKAAEEGIGKIVQS